MDRTFLEILPLAIATTFNPSGLLFVIMILSGKVKPVRHAFTFLFGAATFLIVLGLFIMLTFKPAINSTNHPDALSSAIDIALGILVIVFIGRSFLVKAKPKKTGKASKRPFFIMGMGYMLINASSLIPFIAANKIISENGLGFAESLTIFAALIIIAMTMISFPVLIIVTMPGKSERIMGPVKTFMSKHGSQIARIYFFLMGIYLIAHGVRNLL